MRRNREKRRGIVAVLVAVSLVMLVGIVAVAIDGGLVFDNSRRVYAAADAAALAAAEDLFLRWQTGKGVDTGGTAKAAALAVAAANGFANDGTTNTVTVNIPPASGPKTGKAGYAE